MTGITAGTGGGDQEGNTSVNTGVDMRTHSNSRSSVLRRLLATFSSCSMRLLWAVFVAAAHVIDELVGVELRTG